MKTTIKIVSLFLLLVFLGACDKNQDNLQLTSASLSQTRWNGTLEEINAEGSLGKTKKSQVGFFFVSESKFNYSILWEGHTQGSDLYDYGYTINNKVISFDAVFIRGNWHINYYDGKRMVLEKGTSGEGAYKGTLTLTKK